jgi:tetratricopeptide (TPR) repeat protein
MSQSFNCLTLIVVTMLTLTAGRAMAQDSPRQLFEAGKYQAAIEKTGGDNSPAALYLKGLSHLKLNQADAAKDDFRKIGGDEAWQAVGKSAVALADNDKDGALAAAQAAVGHNAKLAEAQYQLGMVLDARGDNAGAADAFAKATEANPQMAYAHYYAGMNYYEAKRVDRMAVYFENFLKLAPNAPERSAVESIMRTVRGR